jgi:dipeptidyl aminopeptidase/acylaminoacyl peptidase
MHKISIFNYLSAFLFSLSLSEISISVAQSNLKLEELTKGYEFIGHSPENHRWSLDGSSVLFEWNPENKLGNETYFWREGMIKSERATTEMLLEKLIDITKQKNRSTLFYLSEGALFSYDTKQKKHELRLKLHIPINQLIFVNNPNRVYITLENNLFLFDLKLGILKQITNFKTGIEPEATAKSDFLDNQQKELFLAIQEKDALKKWNEAQKELTKIQQQKAIYIGNASLEEVQISPNEQVVSFRLSEYPTGKPTKVEHFISDDGYTFQETARQKVSIKNWSKHKLGLYWLKSDSVTFVDFSELSFLNALPTYLKNTEIEYPKERAIFMHSPIFSFDGKRAIVDIRSLDNKDRWIAEIQLETGKLIELDHQHDEAWIGGPGIGEWDFYPETLGFLSDNKSIYFQSEKTGFSHLYLIDLESKKTIELTNGNWEVRDVHLANDGISFFISANKTHPGNRDFYRLSKTGQLIPIYTQEGAHEVILSADEKKMIVRYSTSMKPWDLFVASTSKPNSWKQITQSISSDFQAINLKKPSVISFDATDGTKIFGRIYEPEKQKKNGAAIIFVHGAGYLQNAHNFWSSYHREFLFHQLLLDSGYTVLDIDYRASDGYGRDFRTGIYRHMGGLDLSDQLDGKKELMLKYGIDSNRVGIYGGSYGGFITLMALFTEPEAFQCGAALRSVTDWAHYNHPYTSNILNYPETDPDAYKRSSPIYFAENLNKKLLLLHGMIDDNVQFQDIIRLTQRLIELKKENWDLAVYPVERHGFVKSYSWYDEYRRILELFNDTLLK